MTTLLNSISIIALAIACIYNSLTLNRQRKRIEFLDQMMRFGTNVQRKD